MPTMPSAEAANPKGAPNPYPTTKDVVEGLVMEIKENLRLSGGLKVLPCRKSSRSSPYLVPSKGAAACCCDSDGTRRTKRSRAQPEPEDPYELLQKLLRDGSLVNEAVRRVQLGLTPKQRYFYESDEDSRSPGLRFCATMQN